MGLEKVVLCVNHAFVANLERVLDIYEVGHISIQEVHERVECIP